MGESSLVAQRASKSTQFFYGFGSISVGIKNNLLGSFLLIYYNQVLGMDAMTVSIAFFIALMIDAISDPLIGIWSDRTQTKYGRRHPFLYFSIIPFCPFLLLYYRWARTRRPKFVLEASGFVVCFTHLNDSL